MDQTYFPRSPRSDMFILDYFELISFITKIVAAFTKDINNDLYVTSCRKVATCDTHMAKKP